MVSRGRDLTAIDPSVRPVRRASHSSTRLHRRLPAVLAMCAAALLLSSAIVACAPGQSTQNTNTGPRDVSPSKSLYPGEVREYKGANLSSIQDFYENSIKGPQNVDAKKYRLAVHGRVETPLKLTYAQVLARQKYDKVVRLDCVEGWSVDIWWEGVLISDLLQQAGADMTSKIVIFRAVDGYSTSLPLDYLVKNQIILANKMNGVVMPPERGFPFMVVAEDRWGYKWCKWVSDIEVSNDSAFKGFWEDRGYSRGGERDKPSTGP